MFRTKSLACDYKALGVSSLGISHLMGWGFPTGGSGRTDLAEPVGPNSLMLPLR